MSAALVIRNPAVHFEVDELAPTGMAETVLICPVIGHKDYSEVRIEMTEERARSVVVPFAKRLGLVLIDKPKRTTRATKGNLTSKYLGVCKRNSWGYCKPYRAQFTHRGKTLVKNFENELDAARQYNEWVEEAGADRPLNIIE